MRFPWTNGVAVPLLAFSLSGCKDSTAPDPDLVDLFLDFCSTETPAFFAFQNDGSSWTAVTPDAAGTFRFAATEKVALAIVHQSGTRFTTEYVFATTSESDLLPLSGIACAEQTGSKTLNGTVANVPAGSAALITMASSSDYVVSPAASYSLTSLPNGALDLIAHREMLGATTIVPDRVIIRRAQDRVDGSTIPILDFANTTAHPITNHTFTATGLSAADNNSFLLNFRTPTTKDHSLVPVTEFISGAQTLYGIPEVITTSGELHELDVFADGGSTYRGATHYYRNPLAQTVAFGPVLNNPTLSTVATTPHLRLRTQLAAQAEYDSFISVFYSQGDNRVVVVTATAGFTGGRPAIWDVTIPDLSGVSGFPASSALQSGMQTDWFVEAYGGTGGAATFFGSPTNLDILRFGGRAATAQTKQMSVSGRVHRGGFSVRSRRRALGAF
jgi:hypothetical protein